MADSLLLESGDRYQTEDGSGGYALDGTQSTTTGTVAGSTPITTGSVAGTSVTTGTVAGSTPRTTGSIVSGSTGTNHSVYSTYPDTLVTSNDGQGITIETSFYTLNNGWRLKGVRLWVPSTSSLVGQTVTLAAWVPGVSETGLSGTPQASVSVALAAGWNQATFTPIALTAGQKLGVSYTTAGDYLTGTSPGPATQASDGSSLYESEEDSGASFTPRYRGAYRYASGSGSAYKPRSGLDVITDDGMASTATTGAVGGSTPLTSGQIAGASVSPTTGVVSGVLPRTTGSVPGTSVTAGSTAGSFPVVTGSVVGGPVGVTSGTVGGTVPVTVASAAGSVVTVGTVTGDLPKTLGGLTGVSYGPTTGSLAAVLPLLSGAVTGGSPVAGGVSGAVPLLVGSVVTAGSHDYDFSAYLDASSWTSMVVPQETVEWRAVVVLVNGVQTTSGVEFSINLYPLRPQTWLPATVRDGKTLVRVAGLTRNTYRLWARVLRDDEWAVMRLPSFVVV